VSSWLDLLLLAVASMFWPTLIVVVVLALRLEHPIRVLAWFFAGGLLATITIGIVLVFTLQGTLSGKSQTSVNPAVDIVAGLLSLAAAYFVYRRERNPRAAPLKVDARPSEEGKPSIAERAVGGGAAVAFTAGVVLNLLPGTFPIVALRDIAELDASNSVKVAAIVVFYVIMFTFVEVPIVAYGFAPERTTTAMNEANSWLARNKLRIAMYVLAGVGLYLVVRGVVDALT
jgi:Sap-like sulfolipid-1-addressing protein